MRECSVFRAMNYRSMAVASLLFWISYPGAVSQTAPASQLNWRSELFAWREAQAKKLQAPDGWLSLAGLEDRHLTTVFASTQMSLRIWECYA
jgi:hypothetical protein